MTREEQLTFCKICSKRQFSRQRGIVCGITGDRASFSDECPDFHEDGAQISKYGTPTVSNSIDDLAVKGSVRFVNYLIDRVVLFGLSIGAGIFIALFSPRYAQNISTFEDYAISFSILVVYYTVFESLGQVSLGKLITGTVVVDMDGNKPSFGLILGRSLSRIIPFDALSFLGANAIGWHDTISKTRVIKKGSIVNNVNNDILDSDFESEFK